MDTGQQKNSSLTEWWKRLNKKYNKKFFLLKNLHFTSMVPEDEV
jgi:hypothetical protein